MDLHSLSVTLNTYLVRIFLFKYIYDIPSNFLLKLWFNYFYSLYVWVECSNILCRLEPKTIQMYVKPVFEFSSCWTNLNNIVIAMINICFADIAISYSLSLLILCFSRNLWIWLVISACKLDIQEYEILMVFLLNIFLK